MYMHAHNFICMHGRCLANTAQGACQAHKFALLFYIYAGLETEVNTSLYT